MTPMKLSLIMPFNLYLFLSSSDACIHHPGVPVFHDAMKVSVGRILMMTLSFECDYVCVLWYIGMVVL